MVWVKCCFIPYLVFHSGGSDEPSARASWWWEGMPGCPIEVKRANQSCFEIWVINGPMSWGGECGQNRSRCDSDPTGGVNVVWGACCHWCSMQAGHFLSE